MALQNDYTGRVGILLSKLAITSLSEIAYPTFDSLAV